MTVTRTLSGSVSEPTLYVAFELGKKDWKLAMTSGFGVDPWLRTVASRDWPGIERALVQGRARFGLCATAAVVSCYEAGRDGFWIHRALIQRGIQNQVVDSASIEVKRRARRAKTDRLDALKLVTMLVRLKGVATTSASVLLDEGLVWRAFQNRRQVGGLLGFAPTPYDSGETTREQGISRAGNARLQAISIQLAWNWVRWQPHSALTQWYRANFGKGKRARRIGIVALARKLVIALWRYVTSGVVPAGAILTMA
jgi:transposase